VSTNATTSQPVTVGSATVAEIREMLGGLADGGDRALLIRVNRWGRENGWETGWSGPTWQSKDRLTGVDWEPDDKAIKVSRRTSQRQLWPLFGPWHPVSSVREAVDTLVMLGVLPVEFSSLYAAGRADRATGGVA
jgi:hypothetical protein